MQQEELATSHRIEDEALEQKFLEAKLEVEMLDAIQRIKHVPSSCSEPASHGRIVTTCHVMPKETLQGRRAYIEDDSRGEAPAREESKPPDDDHRGPEERPGKKELAPSSPRSRVGGRRGQHSRRKKSRHLPWRRHPPRRGRDWKEVLSKIRKATSR